MDLAETMKNVLAKGIQQTSVNDLPSSTSMGFPGTGYVTEKLYMLLQLYLQNKGWNSSVELLQCFSELKESSMLPSAAYLQMMASRVTLDSQGRLILRENGKIILPFEHFANAVMLKHMNGPHGLHLGVEATVRAVMESYTIGRENFGMEKEFIIEVVQNCPNPACRYYKNQMELTQKTLQHLTTPSYLGEPQPNSTDLRNRLGAVDLTGQNNLDTKINQQLLERPKSVAPTQQQITAALIQQQNRVIAQQNIDKLNANLEKQRQQLQLQQQMDMAKGQQKAHFDLPLMDHKLTDFLRANLENLEGLSAANKDLLALHNGAWTSATSLTSSNDDKRSSEGGQEKIVRAFGEVMKNMQRMKTYVRPAMCKPYGKQSEALQKKHRNMPIEDALVLITRNFDAYMRGDKPVNETLGPGGVMSVSDRHPTSMQLLLNLLAENRQVTSTQYDKLLKYLQERREIQHQHEVAEGVDQDSQESNSKQAELQSRIMNILNKAATDNPPPPPENSQSNEVAPPLLKDPSVQKALDSLLGGEMFKNISVAL